MILTKDNIEECNIKSVQDNKELLIALLADLDMINEAIPRRTFFIEVQDYHDEYSPERVDPCPDYYGMFIISDDDGKTYGEWLDIDSLNCQMSFFYELVVDE